jgi:carbonic anhydrase
VHDIFGEMTMVINSVESYRAGALALLVAASTGPVDAADQQAHWSYSGSDGPEHWGALAPEFIQCTVGLNQSPVDLSNAADAVLPPLLVDYSGAAIGVINNGHTAQFNVEPGNYLRVDGDAFELQQFHLHAPSEHLLKGKAFLMEMHLVHRNPEGELAVIGIVYESGETNQALTKLGAVIPATVGKSAPFKLPLAELGLPSEVRAYYRYNGSLTTPPCTEGVRWFVLPEPRTVSPARQAKFIELIGEDARGPQPLNARVILK